MAALLLDREARSVVLDADPAHGSLLEPFLRLIRVLKALEFHQPRGYVDFQNNLDDQIGQDVYELPNVFSFFLPEFQPIGMQPLVTQCIVICDTRVSHVFTCLSEQAPLETAA